MRVLFMTPEVRAAIAKVVAYAEAHVISWPELQARATGAIKAIVGDEPQRCVEIQHGFRCVFSFEMQRWIKCRHLSVSVDAPGKLPSEYAIHEIAKMFGFTDGIKGPNITIYVEQAALQSVNVIEAFVE